MVVFNNTATAQNTEQKIRY